MLGHLILKTTMWGRFHNQAHFSDEKTFLGYTELLTIEVVPIFILSLEYTCPFAPLEMIRL